MAYIVTEFLDHSADRLPDKAAVVDPTRTMTYADMRREALHVAQALVTRGWFQEPIAVYMDQSASCFGAIYGVAYAGCFYTMLDTNMPQTRLNKVLSQLQPRAVLTTADKSDQVKDFAAGAEVLVYEDLMQKDVDEAAVRAVTHDVKTTDVLYVLFTSGSTGMPKGVVTPHQAVISYMDSITEAYDLSEKEVYLNQCPFYYVMSINDVFAVVRNGSTEHLVPRSWFSFPIYLVKYIEKHQINLVNWVPSALCIIANLDALHEADLSCLKKVIFGGENMPIKQLNQWMEALPQARFFNAYGATETTDGATFYEVDRAFDENAILPIGKAFANTRVLVLAEDGSVIPPTDTESVGELCSYGPGTTYGYWNNPEKTAKAFVQNPVNSHYPETIYKIGDLVRWNQYGELEFMGRKDFQIKLRGNRIELGEIEANASAVEGVHENACVFDADHQRIIMYYSGTIDSKDLGKRLRDMLPEYMLPGRRVQLDPMPHNANGKIDRTALKAMMAEKKRK
jgi:D-alanine--poly(phosphoribitol) ligase subunit 1